jgi:2,3-diketo-5-methylthio-1-phosphopentane phosphatase
VTVRSESFFPAAGQIAGILVSDFDGTMTRRDFYDLVRERWPLPPKDDPWERYVAGRCTHFEALAAIFGRIRADAATIDALLQRMELDPMLPSAVAALKAAGWRVIVASAGCAWYINRLLSAAGVELEVHANPGDFSPECGLQMQLPTTSRYFNRQTGIDKAAIVNEAQQLAGRVAFCGDGRPDLAPALSVPETSRFARGWLAGELSARKEPFIRFESWSEIENQLTVLRSR